MSTENSFDQSSQESEAGKLEKRKVELRQNAEEILRQAKESGSWVKDWSPEEDENFIQGVIKIAEEIKEIAQTMPKNIPQAQIKIGSWGDDPKLGFKWTDEKFIEKLRNSDIRPRQKI